MSKVQLSLEISSALDELLEQMAKDTDTTISEVLKKSIALYDLALQEKSKNNHLGIFDDNKQIIREIVGL